MTTEQDLNALLHALATIENALPSTPIDELELKGRRRALVINTIENAIDKLQQSLYGSDDKRLRGVLRTLKANLPKNIVQIASKSQEKELVALVEDAVSAIKQALYIEANNILVPALFDPSDPDVVSEIIAQELIRQPEQDLKDLSPFFGSGVYAIYYRGEFEHYQPLANSGTPIYIGKAEPDERRAKTAREQGLRLYLRLREHRDSIVEVENNAELQGFEGIHIEDFRCRYLVVRSSLEAHAETNLINYFCPIWNKETRVAFGIGKHGDSAETRKNSPSPWDTLHPGRQWALKYPAATTQEVEAVIKKIKNHFEKHPPGPI